MKDYILSKLEQFVQKRRPPQKEIINLYIERASKISKLFMESREFVYNLYQLQQHSLSYNPKNLHNTDYKNQIIIDYNRDTFNAFNENCINIEETETSKIGADFTFSDNILTIKIFRVFRDFFYSKRHEDVLTLHYNTNNKLKECYYYNIKINNEEIFEIFKLDSLSIYQNPIPNFYEIPCLFITSIVLLDNNSTFYEFASSREWTNLSYYKFKGYTEPNSRKYIYPTTVDEIKELFNIPEVSLYLNFHDYEKVQYSLKDANYIITDSYIIININKRNYVMRYNLSNS